MRLREELAAAGYTGAGISQRLHTSGEPIFTHVDLEVYRRRLAAVPDGLSALISLLLLGDPVPPASTRSCSSRRVSPRSATGRCTGSCASSPTTTS